MRSDIGIGHHGNCGCGQIQIQVYNAERPLSCGTAMDRLSDKAAWQPIAQTITHGRCYDITRWGVNSKQWSWFLLYSSRGLNTNFKICFIFGMCDARHLAIGARSTKDLLMFSNLFYFLLHVVPISHKVKVKSLFWVHIQAQSSALQTLTSTILSHWACTVHIYPSRSPSQLAGEYIAGYWTAGYWTRDLN